MGSLLLLGLAGVGILICIGIPLWLVLNGFHEPQHIRKYKQILGAHPEDYDHRATLLAQVHAWFILRDELGNENAHERIQTLYELAPYFDYLNAVLHTAEAGLEDTVTLAN